MTTKIENCREIKNLPSFKIHRLIDANLNRLREGIRVCEDIERYLNDNKELSLKFKKLRHSCKIQNENIYLKARDIQNDVLKESIDSELQRHNLYDLKISNIKRSQESARVLEEVFKLINLNTSEKFKQIRYELYKIEMELLDTSPHK